MVFTPLQPILNGVILSDSIWLRQFVRASRNVRLYAEYKRLDLEASFFPNTCILTKYVHLSIFIQILKVLDLHFQGLIFESSTLASSYLKCAWVLIHAVVAANYTYRQDIKGCQVTLTNNCSSVSGHGGLYPSPRCHDVFASLACFRAKCNALHFRLFHSS